MNRRQVQKKNLAQRLVSRWTRREFLLTSLAGISLGVVGSLLWKPRFGKRQQTRTFIAKASDYHIDISALIVAGLLELQVAPQELKGKIVLLKPNIVEPHAGFEHINTHPLIIRGAVEAFMRLGAAEVIVAEGPGHCHDTLFVLDESGLSDVLREDRIKFVDLNYAEGYTVSNLGRFSSLKSLTFPETLRRVDWIVSMPKLKTHHWSGVTLAMKNLFGLMPGMYYGWPKNVLHFAGIPNVILDINTTIRPHFAIVDAIVGMEGDGPIMGSPRRVGALVMGRNLPSVDATCARIMGVNPQRVDYLAAAESLGPIAEGQIIQVGETIASARTNFQLLDHIPAQRGLRLPVF